jgi:hypothetical protein
MKQFDTVELDVVIYEAFEDYGITNEEIDMSITKRWANDIYQELTMPQQYVQRLGLFVTDKLGKIKTPPNFRIINQIAYRLKKDKNDCTKREEVVQWAQKVWGEDCDIKIEMDCNKCKKFNCSCDAKDIVLDVDYIWERAHPEYYNVNNKYATAHTSQDDLKRAESRFNDKFKLLAYKGPNNGLFRLQHIDSCENLQCKSEHCRYGYAITSNSIDTDLPPDTEVILSYAGIKTDSNGDPLIYDEPNTLEAIKKGILSKHFGIKLLQAQEGALIQKYKYFHESLKVESEMALGRAKSRLDMPSAQELRAFLADVWTSRVRSRGAVNPTSRKIKDQLY